MDQISLTFIYNPSLARKHATDLGNEYNFKVGGGVGI